MPRVLVSLLLAATLALSGCASASKSSFDASGSGLTVDQRTIRESANDRTPAEAKSGDFDWMKDNAVILLAGIGCAAGAAIGGSAGSCLTGAAIGGLTGAFAGVTVFADRQSYADDASYVRDVSTELARIEQENSRVADAADRVVKLHAARIAELNKLYSSGAIDAEAYRSEYIVMRTDEEALRYIVASNKDLSTKIDKALTGITVASSDQARLEEQEATFLGDSSRIEYALGDLTQALAQVPRTIADED